MNASYVMLLQSVYFFSREDIALEEQEMEEVKEQEDRYAKLS